MTFNDFLISIYGFFGKQANIMFSTSIYLGLLGRLIYIISFFIYHKKILQKRTFVKKETEFKLNNTTEFKLNKQFLFKFFAKEMIFILIAIPVDFIAIFILGYSVLAGSQMLMAKTEPTHKFIKGMGILIGPVLYILGILGLAATLTGVFGGEKLHNDLYALIVSGIIFLTMRRGFPKIQTSENYSNFNVNRNWNKIPKAVKVLSLIAVIVVPSLIGGLIVTRIVPKTEDHMIEMRDGIKLNTRVYFPPGWNGSATPVVLSRTPYNLEALDGYAMHYTINQGYIMVGQDIRGTHGSEGDFYFFNTDADDGFDTVAWIQEQDWCNGKIASVGGSALAINQIAYHPNQPEGLRAASMYVGTSEFYEYGMMIGGCLRIGLATNWLDQVGEPDSTIKLLQHPLKDDNYENISLRMNNRYQNVDVRALHVGGWYDMFIEGTIDTFQLYNNGTNYAKDHQILVVGPWSHYLSDSHLDIEYPNSIGLGYAGENEKKIFDEYFKNIPIDWNTQPRIYYYVMGDPQGDDSTIDYNNWRTSNSWPITHNAEAWYLYPDGSLSPTIPSSGVNASYLFDPKNPVRNGGGTTLSLEYIGAVDQRRIEYETYYNSDYNGNFESLVNRSDILKFTSSALTSPVEIIGNISADLYIKSNCTDTDFTAKLIDVFPDGREMWIGDGILKARYRNGYDASNLMNPEEMYKLTINLWSTAYRFVPGHQIRVSISSSNYNKFAVNPNTGVAVNTTHPIYCNPTNSYIANNTVACGITGNMSCIWFPRTL